MKKIFLTAVIIFALAAPMFVSAQGIKDAGKILGQVADPGKTGLSDNLGDSVATVIKTVLALVGTIFLVLTIYAGIMWMTAQGEEEKVAKSKEIIKASIIGLVIIMSAYAITFFVTSRLAGATANQSNSAEPTGPTGCCYDPSGSAACLPNHLESECGSTALWQAGSCPVTCP